MTGCPNTRMKKYCSKGNKSSSGWMLGSLRGCHKTWPRGVKTGWWTSGVRWIRNLMKCKVKWMLSRMITWRWPILWTRQRVIWQRLIRQLGLLTIILNRLIWKCKIFVGLKKTLQKLKNILDMFCQLKFKREFMKILFPLPKVRKWNLV